MEPSNNLSLNGSCPFIVVLVYQLCAGREEKKGEVE